MELGLTSQEAEERRNSIGGSDARIIMSGDDDALIRLWRLKRGEIEWEDDPDNFMAFMGHWCEEANRIWFEKMTGRRVLKANTKTIHPEYDFLHFTQDGETSSVEALEAIFEAKCLNPFGFNMDENLAKYMAQLQHGMMITGRSRAVFSCFCANLSWHYREIKEDPFYQAEMLDRCIAFWTCVKSGTPPVALPPIDAAREGKIMRINVDMTRNNNWASCAADYIAGEEAAIKFEAAKKAIKKSLPQDVAHAFGHGIEIKRATNGAIRFYRTEAKKERAA